MADTSGRLAGVAYISVDGQSYRLTGEASYGVSSVKRETLAGMDGIHGYKETPIPGFIAATLRDAGSLTVADFSSMTNTTVVLELANGKVISGGGMWTVEAQEVKTSEGTFDVRWEGSQVEEV